MINKNKFRFVILIFCCLILLLFLYHNNIINISSNSTAITTYTTTTTNNNKTSKKEVSFNNYYYPMYKDSNNICGIARNKSTSEKVAISSTNDCPTESMLEKNNLAYELTIDDYAPEINTQTNDCGLAHLVQDSSLLSEKDLVKLENKIGDLNNLIVGTINNKCPTITELSDVIKSPIGVPVHFMYNYINININNYPIINFDDIKDTNITNVDIASSEDISILNDYAPLDVYHDTDNKSIPMFIINQKTKQLCGNDMSNCSYNFDDISLTNINSDEKYFVVSSNNINIPMNIINKKTYDICQGDYSQCDLITDDDGIDWLVNINDSNNKYAIPKGIEVQNNNY